MARKRHGRDSAYYKKKADDEWSLLVRLAAQKCALCGKEGTPNRAGMPIVGLHAHHMIERVNFRWRYDFENGLALCVLHHGSYPERRSQQYCAHGTGAVYERYEERVRILLPERWAWWQEHKHDKRRLDFTFQQAFERLHSDVGILMSELGL